MYCEDVSNAHSLFRLVSASADQGLVLVVDGRDPVWRDGRQLVLEDTWLDLGV
jgi:hypothetical protein